MQSIKEEDAELFKCSMLDFENKPAFDSEFERCGGDQTKNNF